MIDIREVARGFEHSMVFFSWLVLLSVTYLDQEWISLKLLFLPLIAFLGAYSYNRFLDLTREDWFRGKIWNAHYEMTYISPIYHDLAIWHKPLEKYLRPGDGAGYYERD